MFSDFFVYWSNPLAMATCGRVVFDDPTVEDCTLATIFGMLHQNPFLFIRPPLMVPLQQYYLINRRVQLTRFPSQSFL